MNKVILTSLLAFSVVLPTIAAGESFPENGYMQNAKTYTGAATSGNMDNITITNGTGAVNAIPYYSSITAGYYMKPNAYEATLCPAGSYCPGKTDAFTTYGATSNIGITACTYGTSVAGSDAASDCQKTITLNKNSGSGTIQGTGGTGNASITCSQGVACNFGSASGLTQTGYTFTGGWGASGCSGTTTSFTNPAETQYYACKTPNVSGQITISYPGDGANATNKTTALWTRYNTGVYTSQANANSNSSAITSITPPALACYDFTGVYSGSTVMINQSGAIQNGLKTLVSSSGGTASIEARFQEWPYAILKDGSTNKGILHYDNNKVYATSACNTPLVAGGQAITVESRTGYTFGGYKCTGYTGNDSQCATYDNNGVLVINESGKVTQEGISSVVDCLSSIDPLTCNAVWNANQYTITFNANGGNGGQSGSKTVTYKAAMPSIDTTAPTRAGYVFGGWYNAQTGGTKIYEPNGSPAVTSWNFAEDKILYARWTAGVITITWYGVGNGTETGGIGNGFAAVSGQNNVYTSNVNYDGDIRTPGVITGGATSTGRTFLGWKFKKN